jgi:hypothetical protein
MRGTALAGLRRAAGVRYALLKGLFLTASFDVCPSMDPHAHTAKLTWYCISSVLARASREQPSEQRGVLMTSLM